jgi:hypothetical protein
MPIVPNTQQPMTLGNMRANGVHTLAVWCDWRGRSTAGPSH